MGRRLLRLTQGWGKLTLAILCGASWPLTSSDGVSWNAGNSAAAQDLDPFSETKEDAVGDDPFAADSEPSPSPAADAPAADDPFSDTSASEGPFTGENQAPPLRKLTPEERREQAAKTITFLKGEIPAPLTNEQAQKKLQEITAFEFEETPLSDVVEYLKQKHEAPIQIDVKALNEVGVGADVPITRKVSGISLESALRLTLQPLELDLIVQNGVLLISIPEEQESHQEVHIYPVRDLIENKSEDHETLEDPDLLMHLIVNTIQPNTWDEVGGRGAIEAFDGQLIVCQLRVAQNEVDNLLTALREYPTLDSPDRGKKLAVRPIPEPSVQALKITAALAEPLKVEFRETPLDVMVDALSEQYGIDVQLDRRSMEEIGVSSDTPVSMHDCRVTLGQSLRMALRSRDMDYVIRDDSLLLTSPETAQQVKLHAVYPVFDLLPLAPAASHDDILSAMNELQSAIEASIFPNTWDTVGGAGVVRPFAQRGVLLVANTREVHAEIVSLLAQMRAAKSSQPPAAPSTIPAEDEILVIGYQLLYEETPKNAKGEPTGKAVEHVDTKKLVEMIRSLIVPDSWQEHKEAQIWALPDRLLVRHEKRVQREIEILLTQLGINYASGAPNDTILTGDMGGRFLTPQQRKRIPFGGGRAVLGGGSFFNVPNE